jgi:hypothetical protein
MTARVLAVASRSGAPSEGKTRATCRLMGSGRGRSGRCRSGGGSFHSAQPRAEVAVAADGDGLSVRLYPSVQGEP